ncbi:hypothetical protein [Aeromicrobium wangtongii]|uniref:DUF4089 domain-containing protein n=1 Tax=Aeromicrobium wangtongii TaxID=2969247 RepID=A0ABY5M4Y6_9ACTN|nr:hypothetical protein [Aeromicrobium wangtongii]MCD9198716.1 hypothetical protein [Aeromicrobium wangtongii]UUP13238.1 hypothetical protein NQV15_15490 [Aeromicrobium wangtongii]
MSSSPAPTPDHATTVRAMIAAAGLTPDPAEIDAAIAGYASLRASVDRLHALDLDHEEDLVVSFEA